MDSMLRITFAFLILLSPSLAAFADGVFRVKPYLQNPATDAVTVCWFTHKAEPGTLTVQTPDGPLKFPSQPVPAETLDYNPFGKEPGEAMPRPYKHRIRVTGLRPGVAYAYTVRQNGSEFSDVFHAAPDANTPIRFMLYSDSETEPESTGAAVDWPPGQGSERPAGITKYLVDQTTGYRENLKMIDTRRPDFISVVGDLVESGGEQRDWDEFWKHNAGEFNTLAGHIPLLAAIGNHENYGGPGQFGGYNAQAADYAVDKYLAYFEFPSNGAGDPHHEGRYYRIDYGPITLITLDSSDGLPQQTEHDTNHNLTGSHAPDFNPGSEQYAWLERQLAEAQARSRFTFVQYHHTAYGSGPHSVPFGKKNFSGQSGIAMRVLQPLLVKYGVDAVFSGHDEMLERSMVGGVELLPDGSSRPHELHYYDVGYGGDGLRGSAEGYENPYRKFLAHDDAPEVWSGRKLLSGGKHYGHLEVNVAPDAQNRWTATLVFAHVFPACDDAGKIIGWERRTYDDLVTLVQP
jgi:hypothetical protein